MSGKFIQLVELGTFLTNIKTWVTENFVDLISFNTWKNTIKAIATSGNASDVSISDSGSYFDSTNVEGALQELGADLASSIEAGEVTLEVKGTPNTGYLKSYTIKQGGVSIGDIDIPKDLVVTGGSVVTGTWNNGVFTEDQVQPGSGSGKALKLSIANQTGPVYINVADLVDVYTASPGAAKIQLAISAGNVISASVVAGSIEKTDLVQAVQTSLGKADTALQPEDIVIATNADINALFAS
jgi:hypothetical protein